MAEISTEDAVEQLHQMFGDYEKSVLAAVLEAHGGHVERTVEHLLVNTSAVGGGGDRGGGGGGGSGAAPRTDYDNALALQLSREWADDPSNAPPPPTIPIGIPTPYGARPVAAASMGGGGGVGRMGGGSAAGESGNAQARAAPAVSGGTNAPVSSDDVTTARRGRRVALPQEFLRKPGWTPEGSGGVSAGSGDPQLAADAKLAMMLQNQAFQRELQTHPDLAHLGWRSSGGHVFRETDEPTGPTIKEQLTVMGNDVRRKLDELAVRWKMKEPGRADETTQYSSVPLLGSQADDVDDQAEVVHFSQDSTTRRSHSSNPIPASSPAAAGLYRADSAGEERLADPRRIKKDR